MTLLGLTPNFSAWGIARPQVLTALGLPAEPDGKLDELDQAYRQVVEGLGPTRRCASPAARIELEKLGPEPEPPRAQAVRDAVAAMPPPG